MVKYASAFLALSIALPAMGEWTNPDNSIGRQLSTGYGIDTVDHYSGEATLVHTDYQLLLGQASYLPISRKESLMSSGFGRPMYAEYNLGQLLSSSLTLDHTFCDTITEDDKKPAFKGLNGESVVFTKHNSVTGKPKTFISKSNWLLTCATDDPDYPVQLTAPNGLRFYYDRDTQQHHFHPGMPKILKDPNGNTARFDQLSLTDLNIVTPFQTLSFTKNGLSISGISQPLVTYESISGGYKIKYAEESYWSVRKKSSSVTEVCNPLKTCVDFEIKKISLGAAGSSDRLVKKTYHIPHHGNYSITYDYTYPSGTNELIVKATHGDHLREYRYYHTHSNSPLYWKLGNLLKETVFTSNSSSKYQEKTFEYEPSLPSFKGDYVSSNQNGDIGKYAVVPRLTKETTKRWSNATTNGQFTWVGTVEVTYSDFDLFNNPQSTSYRYPSPSGSSTLYPTITYLTEREYDLDIHRLGLVKRTELEGLAYYSEYSYDRVGNLTGVETNGRTESFSYNQAGEKVSYTDAEGNIYSYSNHSFGIPRQETGPEGYILTRTVDNGFVSSETLYGNRTTTSVFDPFGKLIEYQPAEPGREPIRYHYTFPASGGMVLVEENGGLLKTTRFNGMGLPYQIEVEGTGSGTGNAYHFKKVLTYYNDGTLKAESLPVSATTTPSTNQYSHYYQDPVGRRTSINPVDGSAITFQYNAPFETLMTDGAGVKTREKYRPFANFGTEKLVERTHHAGNTLPSPELKLSLSYFNNGWLDTVKMGSKSHLYNYDQTTGFLKSVFTPETGLIEYKYNKNGQVIWEKHNTDTPLEYDYDDLGRISKRRYSDSAVNVTYTYNDIERIFTGTKGAYTWQTEYDLDGNLTREYLKHDTQIEPPSVINTYPLYSSHTGRSAAARSNSKPSGFRSFGHSIESQGFLDWDFSYTYDSKGFLAKVTYPDGEEVGYLPNAIGQPTQAASYAHHAQYFPNGALKSLSFGNGQTISYQQDANTGQLKATSLSNTSYWNKGYHYSTAGYLTAITDANNSNDSRYFEYDQLYQLKRVRSKSSTGPVLETFTYSTVGDLISRTAASSNVSYTYNSQTNRLSSVVIDGQTHLLGYTPDGRVTAYGQSDYAYTSDKLLAEFSKPDGSTYRYEYDSNNQKVRVSVDNQLQRYTIHSSNGQLMYEERPDDTSSNFIYLNGQLVATRDTEYDLAYTECDYIENRAKRETVLYHRPVWLRRFDNEPVGYGNCESYGKWAHNYASNSGTWEVTNNTERRYHVWMHHYNESGDNMGTLYDFLLYKDAKQANGNPYRKYHSKGTKRKYTCHQRWRVVRYTYDQNGKLIATNTVKSGEYETGRERSWKAWQSKPNFSCGSASLDTSKVSWP